MVVGEVLCADDAMHVRFHEFLDEVDFCKGIVRFGFLNVEDGDDLSVSMVGRKEKIRFRG